MGNYTSHQPFGSIVKVVHLDGTLQEFTGPITAAELMLEHPQQVVVELQSMMASRRPEPLPADTKLETKKVYVMLPMQQGKPASLSSEQSKHVLLRSNSSLSGSSWSLRSTKLVPLFGRMCSGGFVNIPEDRVDEKRLFKRLVLHESLHEMPEFLSRQVSMKGWKPSLDTIEETEVNQRIPHWLF